MTSRPDEGERRGYAALMRELIALAEELRRGLGSCLLDGRSPTSRRRFCQAFPVVAGSTISKTVRPCAVNDATRDRHALMHTQQERVPPLDLEPSLEHEKELVFVLVAVPVDELVLGHGKSNDAVIHARERLT